MRQITPQLWAYSVIAGSDVGAVVETRELDFSLSRRAAIVINRIEGFLHVGEYTTVGHNNPAAILQELDLDPDNVDVWLGDVVGIDAYEIDSSRAYRQSKIYNTDTASGTVEASDSQKDVDWHAVPLVDRPISTRNLRHHVRTDPQGGNVTYQAELCIRYFIVELSLAELGYINASRR